MSPEKAERALAYEATLRYYVLGLRHARSPHAFHTIGSTISVCPHAYAAVRGVPKRAAAEDFYLLQKLRTIGTIEHVRTEPIIVSPRTSHRVPFGTGPAVAAAASLDDPWMLRTYDPRAFDDLSTQGQLDALQTLRFVRARSEQFGGCALREAISRARFIPFEGDDTLASLCDRLAQLERIE